MNGFKFSFFIAALFLLSCQSKESADLVIWNGTIHTLDDHKPKAEALVVQQGLITFVGAASEAKKYIGKSTQTLDLQGKTLIPGFIEGHAHMIGVGDNEVNLNLSNTKNYSEVISMVREAADKAKPGEWIKGMGWHQSKWENPTTLVKGFPIHDSLSMVSPQNPVILNHASGHAILVNDQAMKIANIESIEMEVSPMEKEDFGEVIRDPLGNPTGVFNEAAMDQIFRHVPKPTDEDILKAIKLGNALCLRNGITSFHDAGNGAQVIDNYKRAIDKGDLKVRMYVMLDGSDSALLNSWYSSGPLLDYGDKQLTVRSIKMYMDGALGSRGAWLLEPYEDRTDHYGHATTDPKDLYPVVLKSLENGFQLCSHAIGDRANREVLDAYEKGFRIYPDKAQDPRFRIEHSQHIDGEDIPRFAQLNVIASMQAIHLSSDRPWAIDRLGKERIEEGAYVWQKLLQSGAVVVNGTDAPVEPISPIASFYASVTRKTLNGEPEDGYESSQKMTRVQALRSYTLDAAYGAFEEDVKGSVEVGKLADFTVLNQDIMTVPEEELLKTTIVYTIINGEIVYQFENEE